MDAVVVTPAEGRAPRRGWRRFLASHRQAVAAAVLVFAAAIATVVVPDPADGQNDLAVRDAVRQAIDTQYAVQALWHAAPPTSYQNSLALRTQISQTLEDHFTGTALAERLTALATPRGYDAPGVQRILDYRLTSVSSDSEVRGETATASGTYVVVVDPAGAAGDGDSVAGEMQTRSFSAGLRKIDGTWFVSSLGDRLLAAVPVARSGPAAIVGRGASSRAE